MKTSYWILLSIGLLIQLLGLTGCDENEQDTLIPWARPADWESSPANMRGMPQNMGGAR
ncbi:MAG TPA: hypothetical protein PLV25_02180 [Opitutales bacterium]|nr:hypothetical protein [Opitutales bacterium]